MDLLIDAGYAVFRQRPGGRHSASLGHRRDFAAVDPDDAVLLSLRRPVLPAVSLEGHRAGTRRFAVPQLACGVRRAIPARPAFSHDVASLRVRASAIACGCWRRSFSTSAVRAGVWNATASAVIAHWREIEPGAAVGTQYLAGLSGEFELRATRWNNRVERQKDPPRHPRARHRDRSQHSAGTDPRDEG